MGTEIKTLKDKATSMRSLLLSDKSKDQFKMALPNVGLTAERFVRMALTAFQRQPKLYECDPSSVMGCLVQAAQSGLSPSGISGECYLVPFENRKKGIMEAQFIPGYRGLMKVARRSGEVLSIAAEVVFTNDEFRFEFGSMAKLYHKPATENRGDPQYVWALAKLKGMGEQFTVMTVADVEKIRKASKASQNGPWVSHWEEMAKKTVLRRLCKYLPISDDEMRLVELAAQEESGLPQTFDMGEVLDVPAEKVETAPPEETKPQAAPAKAAPAAAQKPAPKPAAPQAPPAEEAPPAGAPEGEDEGGGY